MPWIRDHIFRSDEVAKTALRALVEAWRTPGLLSRALADLDSRPGTPTASGGFQGRGDVAPTECFWTQDVCR
jgi:hypothetical protein